MMLNNRLTGFVFSLFVVICAYGQDVHYNYDRGANFGGFKTYQWVQLPDAVSDQLIDRDIKRAVDEQLTEKGLTKVENGADLYVGYHAVVNLEKGLTLWSTGMGGFGGPGGWGDRSASGQTSTIPIGMLFVDIYDASNKQLIWRGDANKAIDLKKDPDKNYKSLQKTVAKLLKNYPPQSDK